VKPSGSHDALVEGASGRNANEMPEYPIAGLTLISCSRGHPDPLPIYSVNSAGAGAASIGLRGLAGMLIPTIGGCSRPWIRAWTVMQPTSGMSGSRGARDVNTLLLDRPAHHPRHRQAVPSCP